MSEDSRRIWKRINTYGPTVLALVGIGLALIALSIN